MLLVILKNGLTSDIPPDIQNLNKLKRFVIAENYSIEKFLMYVFNVMNELLILDSTV